MPSLPPDCERIRVLMPDHPAVGVEQRAAAVAGVDAGVGLQVDHRALRLELPGDGADHAHAHRALEPEGRPEREHQLARTHGLRVAQGQGGQALLGEEQHREVRFAVDADHLGAEDAAGRLEDGAPPPGGPAGGGTTTSMRRAPAITWALVTTYPSECRMTPEPPPRWLLSSDAAFAGRRVAGHQHLHDRGPDALGQGLQVFAQARQPGSGRGGPRGGLRERDPGVRPTEDADRERQPAAAIYFTRADSIALWMTVPPKVM